MRPKARQVLLIIATGLCGWTLQTHAGLPRAGELAATVAGSHVWRGEIISQDPVFQPSLYLDFEPCAVALWGSWELDAQPHSSQRRRMNATIDHLYENGGHIFRSGLTAFLYQDSTRYDKDDTLEVFFGYTRDSLFLPTVTAHYDLGHFKGLYVLCTASHALDLIEDTLRLYARLSLGWGDEQHVREFFTMPRYTRDTPAYRPEEPALLDLTLKVEAPMRFTEHFKVVPGLTYMYLLDSDLRNALKADGQDADNLSGRLSLILDF